MHCDTKYINNFQPYKPDVCINNLYICNRADYQLAQFQNVIELSCNM